MKTKTPPRYHDTSMKVTNKKKGLTVPGVGEKAGTIRILILCVDDAK